ncbi:BMP family ABC transporter substrate-binding protein [Phytoactinopolyspora halotolerans]|uniref:BMP family ABC transporter substrate-binding protein n=2 Tax=Phytoactinopolyspora halotolerans TaxID=1981512 RepID=A0A6L9S5C1_9ACTN|nr:BMP family ABC transporter substrate-binding protein [Phytoactinopolyspora halotolerans]
MKLAAGFATAALLLTACAEDDDGGSEDTTESGEDGGSGDGLQVGLAFDVGGRGDRSFNDSAAAGIERAQDELGIEFNELSPNPDGSNRDELLRELADGGHEIIFGIGYAFGEDMDTVADEYPDVQFVRIDGAPSDKENVAVMNFADHQGSFLVGVAAALMSESGQIGFVGGNEGVVINAFGAGFKQGVAAVDDSIEVEDHRLAAGEDPSGFDDAAGGRVAAEAMYDRGVEVVFTAAGDSNVGVFQAAADAGAWAAGTDSDQYETVGDPELQEVIFTSMLKRVDNAVFESIDTYISEGDVESTVYDLSDDGVGYSTSGDHMSEDIIAQLEDYKQQIIDGEIEVSSEE